MAIVFPPAPTIGDQISSPASGITWEWTGSVWKSLGAPTAGPTGPSGVIAVTSPITNSGTSTSANIGIDQSLITIAESQVTGLTAALSGKAATSHTQNASTIITSVTDKSANYTLVAGDKNSYIRSTNSEITITVPDILADGESVNFIQAGTGQITFAASGITLNSAEAKLKTARQFAGVTVTKLGGAYYLVGNLG